MRYTVQNRISEAALMSYYTDIIRDMYERQHAELGRCVFSQMGTQPYVVRLKTEVTDDDVNYHKTYRTSVDFTPLEDMSELELLNLSHAVHSEFQHRQNYHLFQEPKLEQEQESSI